MKLRKSMKDKTLILLWVTSLPPWIHPWRAGSYCLLGLDRRKQTGQYSQHMEKMITETLLHFVMQSGSVALKAPGVFKKKWCPWWISTVEKKFVFSNLLEMNLFTSKIGNVNSGWVSLGEEFQDSFHKGRNTKRANTLIWAPSNCAFNIECWNL